MPSLLCSYAHVSFRSTAATGANADSSRSHAIMQVALKRSKDRSKDMGMFHALVALQNVLAVVIIAAILNVIIVSR